MHVNSRVTMTALVAAGAAVLLAGCDFKADAGALPPTTVTSTVSESTVSEAPADTETTTEESTEEPAETTTDDPAPCTADVVEPRLWDGDHSRPEIWNSAVVVTNVGTTDCRLEGVSDLTFIGQSGDPYDVDQATIEEGAPADLVVVAPGEQASMPFNYDSAAEDAPAPENCSSPVSAVLTLPDDQQPLELSSTESGMPPLCDGPVSVSPWASGGY